MRPSQIEVRPATADDIENIVKLGRSFYHLTLQAKAGHEYGPEKVADLCQKLIDSDSGIIFVAYMNDRLVGMAAFLLEPTWFLKDHLSLQEIWWFVHPSFRKFGIGTDLLDIAEFWARTNGAQSMMMVNLDNLDPKVKEIYLGRGFIQQETTYLKEL